MIDNSRNFNSLQERNKQVLANISQLQIQEKNLYDILDDINISTEQKQQTIKRINEISQMRINLYYSLKDMYSFYQTNISESRETLSQEVSAINILENELNDSKIRMNLLEDEKNNKIRLVEINTYYGKKYNAYSKIMKTIVIFCVPLIILAVLKKKGFVPPTLYILMTCIIITISIIIIWRQVFDIFSRDNMNWDEYDFNFVRHSAPSDSAMGAGFINPWDTPSIVCIGSACCHDGSSYDNKKNKCIPGAVYEQTHPIKEPFKGLVKYANSHVKASSLNSTILPSVASFSSNLFK